MDVVEKRTGIVIELGIGALVDQGALVAIPQFLEDIRQNRAGNFS